MDNQKQLRIAIDIGGTFTDTVLANKNNEILATAKNPTTTDNPTIGALAGTRHAIDQTGVCAQDISTFIHGTTLATNALIERRGASVACITTEGFRDILEIGYERRYSQYDIGIDKPDLIVNRSYCYTVKERLSAKGKVVIPLDESGLDELAMELENKNISSLAICLLHAYANPIHEQKLQQMLLQRLPDLSISLSSEVSPEAREFDRLCTTLANAYIKPMMSRYLEEFVGAFKSLGIECPVLMMTAGGGMTTIESAIRFPIRLVESGPAGGAILAAKIAASCDINEVLSFDMGGTTAKLCLIDEYLPQTSRQFEIARAARFIKGSGMPVRIPVVEMIEIGAGGGSIASVDNLSRLLVGPKSAGSNPGPAAFGNGGLNPTVTDSDFVMGLIDPELFAEGRLKIDIQSAEDVIQNDVANKLNINCDDAALGISQIVDEAMASAARMHAVESGKNLSNRTMIAFGGNGPLHATRVARRAGVENILIPRDPGVGSALGFLYAPVSFESVRSYYTTLEDLNIGEINQLFESMIAESEQVVQAGAIDQPIFTQRSAFMRYCGQGHEIEVKLANRDIQSGDIPQLTEKFDVEYRRQYARIVPGMKIEILNWSVRVFTAGQHIPKLEQTVFSKEKFRTSDQTRIIICDLTGKEVKAAIYHRDKLTPEDQIAGPALIVESQTTTLVSQDFIARVDCNQNLLLTRIRENTKLNLKITKAGAVVQ